MTDQGRRCPNGHPVFATEGFCEACGAPFGAPSAPPPGWGQQPPPGWGAPQQPTPPAWGQQAQQPPAWGQQAQQPPPGWGAPQQPPPGWAPPPQGWSPQGQAAWGGPPPKKGGGCGRTLLILLVLLLLGGVAYVLIAKPSWSPLGGVAAAASPGLTLKTPAPSGTAETVTPDPLDSAGPGTSVDPGTSVEPTAAGSIDPNGLQTCRRDDAGITVGYPAGWYTASGDADWQCVLFDPSPIEVLPNTELPPVALIIQRSDQLYDAVVRDFSENAEMWELLDSETGEVDGLPATAIYVRATGNGLTEQGLEKLVVAVDVGSRGMSLVMEVTGTPGDAFDANSEVLGTVIETIKIDR